MRHMPEKVHQQPGGALPLMGGHRCSRGAVILTTLVALTLAAETAAAAPPAADLELRINAPSTAPVNVPTMIELRALNLGPSSVTFASLGIEVPSGVTVAGVTPSESCATILPNIVACTISSLAANQTFLASLNLVFTVPGMFTFGASVSGAEFDPNFGNNISTATVTAVAPGMARLFVVKEDGPDPVISGEKVAYGIAVMNTGTATARAVKLTDTLPPHVTVVSELQAGCRNEGNPDQPIVICELGDLPPGATVIVEIIVGTFLQTPSPMLNQVRVESPDAAPAFAGAATDIVSSGAHFAAAGFQGDPVSTFTGELFTSEAADFNLGGPLPVTFERYYGSGLERDGRIAGRLGTNWLHNYEALLRRDGDRIEAVTNQGRVVQFGKSGDVWIQIGKLDLPFQLVERGAGFILGDPRTDLLWTFDSTGRLVRIEDDAGNAHTLAYTGEALTQVSDGLGRTLTFSYDGTGHLSTVSDGARTTRFGHTGNDLTSVTDPLGNVTTYHYEPAEAGRLIATTRPRGNMPSTQTYDAAGRVTSQTDAEGNTFTLSYGLGETIITDPLGQTQRHAHTDQGELVAFTDETAQVVALGYDDTGRRESATDRLGDTTVYTYHAPSGKLASITGADGATTTLTYTPRDVQGITLFDVTAITFPDGARRSLAYDAAGNLVRITDEAGNVSSYTYNDRGQPLTGMNRAGGTVTLTYNADATLATLTAPDANTTAFAYDVLKRINRLSRPDGTTQTYTHDARDLLLTITNERGHTTSFTYDANGKLESATDALGNTTTFAYDGLDRPIRRTDPLGHPASLSYDELGRVRALTDRNGNTLTVAYDARGNPMALTDPSGQVWTRRYDAESIIEFTTDPLSHTRHFASDALGRITQVTSPLGEVSRFTYDNRRRLTHLQDPLGNVVTQQYDVRGYLAGRTLSGGTIAAGYARDALARIAQITDPNGNVWERPRDSLGRPTAAIDPLGQMMAFEYDTRGRLSRIVLPGGLGSMELTFDGTNNLTRRRYSDGTELQYVYDASDRLVAADGLTLSYNGDNRLVESNGIGIGRDPGGRITSLTLGPGKVVSYAYEARNRLTQVTDWLGGVTTFSYDVAGRLSTVARPNGVTTTYTYDANDRLIGVVEGTLSSVTLTRDARGEVIAATRQGPSAPSVTTGSVMFSYDAASQVEGFLYDGLGRLISDGRRTYTWDLASRLQSYTEGGQTVNLTYDAAGYRLSRSAGGVTRSYLWNYALALPSIAVEREDGADLRYYVHTPAGVLLYSLAAGDGSRRFYHYDHVGSTVFLTDDHGVIRTSYAYTPHGVLLASQGDDANPFTYLGGYGVMREGPGGLYYMRARYYDSESGRFITRDPIESIDPRAINPYQYAFANPVRYVDPLGLCWECGHYAAQDFANYLGSDRGTSSTASSRLDTYADVQGVLNTAFDVEAEFANQLAQNVAPRAAPAIGFAGNGASAVLTAGTEFVYGESYTTVVGRGVGSLGVAATDTLATTVAAPVVIPLKVVDATVAVTVGSEYAPKVLDVVVANGPRGVVAVGESVANGNLNAVDQFTYSMQQAGGVPGLLVQGIDGLVDGFFGGDPERFGTPANNTARADAQRRRETTARIATSRIAQEASARAAPQKFLEAFRQKFSRP